MPRRPYTPTTLDQDKGIFELVIKSYPEGNVSSYVCGLKVGDKIEVKGPFPKLKYVANMKKKIGMVNMGMETCIYLHDTCMRIHMRIKIYTQTCIHDAIYFVRSPAAQVYGVEAKASDRIGPVHELQLIKLPEQESLRCCKS